MEIPEVTFCCIRADNKTLRRLLRRSLPYQSLCLSNDNYSQPFTQMSRYEENLFLIGCNERNLRPCRHQQIEPEALSSLSI